MGTPREAQPAKLLVAVMHRPDRDPEPVVQALAGLYGAVDSRSAPYPFGGTDYYAGEMGPGLVKFLVSFGPLIPQDRLASVKRRTNLLEKETADAGGGRAFNLDPGLLTLSSLVLATTKGCAHRVYMGEGIWEEVTLLYARGAWQALPWTYPDYRSAAVTEYLSRAREILRGQSGGAAHA